MKKTILIALSVFLLVLSGGYCVTWYAQANATKQAIERAIARLNEKQQYVTYEAIETSGFPYNIFISIVKPHFNGRIDLLLKALPSKTAEADTTPPMPEWNEDITLNGRIITGINVLSDHYSLKISGDWRETSKIGEQTTTIVHQQLGDMACLLEMQRSQGIFDTLWNFKTLARDADALVKDFRMVDCYNPGKTITDETTKTALGSSGPIHLYALATPGLKDTQTRIYLKIADVEITAQGDAMATSYMHLLSPSYPYPMNFSVYGKQNLEADLIYKGQTDWQKSDNPAIDISLAKFDLTNQVYEHHLTFHLDNAPAAGVRKSALYFRAESSFAEQYDALLQTIVRGFIQQTYTSNDPHLRELQATVQKYTPDQLYSILYPVIPNFHAMGKMVQSVDATFEGTPDMKTGTATLNDLELSVASYGIHSNGNAKLAAGAMPTGSIVLACRNCVQMIDDFIDYSGRLQKVVSYFDTNKAAAMALNPKQIDATKDFLRVLAAPAKDPANATTYTYTLGSDKAGSITLNGRTMNQVMLLYKEYVEPTMKKTDQIPAAGDGIRPWHSH